MVKQPTNEDILSELKINLAVKKIQNYRNKLIHCVWQIDRDRQTATLNCEISTVWETKPRVTPRNTSGLLVGPEKVTRQSILYHNKAMSSRAVIMVLFHSLT